MFHDTYIPGMSRFTPSPLEYDAAMHEEMRAWYDAHRQDILRPPSTASSSPSMTSTPLMTSNPAVDDASPPEAQEGTADEPVVV
jgi:hypothetical protein